MTTPAPNAYGVTGPHLRLRWQETDQTDTWHCHYELVLTLGENDIRLPEQGDPIHVVSLGVATERHSAQRPCFHSPVDRPYRNGAHAKWDSAKLGNLPIYVISPGGIAALYTPEKD